MAKTIGSQSFDIFRGTVTCTVAGTDEFRRPGVDGVSVRQIGSRGVESELLTVNYISGADDDSLKAQVGLLLEDLAKLVGTSVTIVDAHGISQTNCRIVDHTPVVSTVSRPITWAKGKRVGCRWTVRKEPA